MCRPPYATRREVNRREPVEPAEGVLVLSPLVDPAARPIRLASYGTMRAKQFPGLSSVPMLTSAWEPDWVALRRCPACLIPLRELSLLVPQRPDAKAENADDNSPCSFESRRRDSTATPASRSVARISSAFERSSSAHSWTCSSEPGLSFTGEAASQTETRHAPRTEFGVPCSNWREDPRLGECSGVSPECSLSPGVAQSER